MHLFPCSICVQQQQRLRERGKTEKPPADTRDSGCSAGLSKLRQRQQLILAEDVDVDIYWSGTSTGQSCCCGGPEGDRSSQIKAQTRMKGKQQNQVDAEKASLWCLEEMEGAPSHHPDTTAC